VSERTWNEQLGVYFERDDTTGLLNVAGHVTDPDTDDASGYWLTAVVDDRSDEVPQVLRLTISDEMPDVPDRYRRMLRNAGTLEDGSLPVPVGIGTRLLRNSPIAAIREAVAAHSGGGSELPARLPDPRKMTRRDNRFFAAVAARYQRAVAAKTKAPVVAVATELGMDRDQVRDALVVARNRQLITRGVQGRGGGLLTRKGIEALDREEA
jgi:hypothetical protein